MRNCDVICRMATKKDDLGAIARYLHLTDPYIYPVICDDPDALTWRSIISECFFAKNNLFSMENIAVAEYGGKIIGVICIIPCGERKRFIEDLSSSLACLDGVKKANKGYFLPLIEESESFGGYNITNVCVDKEFRRMGVGERLIGLCIERFGASDIHLDVIADNDPAIRLYKRMGFEIVKDYFGFSGTEALLPCYHMERPAQKA